MILYYFQTWTKDTRLIIYACASLHSKPCLVGLQDHQTKRKQKVNKKNNAVRHKSWITYGYLLENGKQRRKIRIESGDSKLPFRGERKGNYVVTSSYLLEEFERDYSKHRRNNQQLQYYSRIKLRFNLKVMPWLYFKKNWIRIPQGKRNNYIALPFITKKCKEN